MSNVMDTIPYGHQSISKKDIKEVLSVFKSDWITQGPKIEEFEEALCKYTGAKYAVAVSSGTAALHIASLSMGIRKGDEVITSPITFAATANSILYSGGQPIFSDIQKDTVNIDPEEIKKDITKKTKAIIPVHFSGHPCDMKEIYHLAKKNGLIIIEDAAHALGAEYRGQKIGSCRYSDMAIFSFHPVKSITTGEGGAILTNRKELYKKASLLRNHGITKKKKDFLNLVSFLNDSGSWYYEMQALGFNYRITDFQSALGINQLKRLDKLIKQRKDIATIYNKELSGIDEISLPIEKNYVESAFHIYCIRIKDDRKRKHVFESLRKCGIGVQVHYIPVYLHPYYRKRLGFKEGLCPLAEIYYKQTITLPLYSDLSLKDIKRVIKALKNILTRS